MHAYYTPFEYAVQGGNQVPPISITVTRPDKLMRKACFSHNALDDIKEPTVSKVSEETLFKILEILVC